MTDEIWNHLMEIAQADGVVSTDETRFIETVITNIKNYNDFLSNALEDNVIDRDEKMQLAKLRANILRNSMVQALADTHVTRDERELIKAIKKIHSDLRKAEKQYMQ